MQPGFFLVLAFFFLAAAASVSAAAAAKNTTATARFRSDVTACRALNPVTDETLENLQRSGELLDHNDQDARCFVECVMRRGGMVDEEGTFSAERARDYISALYEGAVSVRHDAAVRQCAESRGSGRCMKSYKIWTCLYTALRAAPA